MFNKTRLITLFCFIGISSINCTPIYAFSNQDILRGNDIIGENLRNQNNHFTFTLPISNQDTYQEETKEAFKQFNDYIKNNSDEYDSMNVQSVEEQAAYSQMGNKLEATFTLNVNYLANKEQEHAVNAKVDQALSEIIKPSMNDHQKVKVIHDWIINHVTYDKTYKKYSAYNAAIEGSSVCQGFALLGYKMFSKAGIPANIVSGTGNGGLHAWNMVQIEGNWYQIDLTWDENYKAGGANPYEFYLKTNKQFQPLHQFDASKFPKAQTDYIGLLQAKAKNDSSYQELQDSITKDDQKNIDYHLLYTSSVKTMDVTQKTIKKQAEQVNQDVVQPMMNIFQSNVPLQEKFNHLLSLLQSLDTKSKMYLGLGSVILLGFLTSRIRR